MLSGVATIMKTNPIRRINELSARVRKSIKNSVPIAKQPRVSSVEALLSKGSS